MEKKENLRPVEVLENRNKIKGYFHRFVYMMGGGYSETKVLIELSDGKLRYYDPYFVQFTDRPNNKDEKCQRELEDEQKNNQTLI